MLVPYIGALGTLLFDKLKTERKSSRSYKVIQFSQAELVSVMRLSTP